MALKTITKWKKPYRNFIYIADLKIKITEVKKYPQRTLMGYLSDVYLGSGEQLHFFFTSVFWTVW